VRQGVVRLEGVALEGEETACGRQRPRFRSEPRLPDTRLPGDEHRTTRPTYRSVHRPGKRLDVGRAADAHRADEGSIKERRHTPIVAHCIAWTPLAICSILRYTGRRQESERCR